MFKQNRLICLFLCGGWMCKLMHFGKVTEHLEVSWQNKSFDHFDY